MLTVSAAPDVRHFMSPIAANVGTEAIRASFHFGLLFSFIHEITPAVAILPKLSTPFGNPSTGSHCVVVRPAV